MIIGISGTLGSGKTEIARYLTQKGFEFIDYKRDTSITDRINGLDLNEATLDINELTPQTVFESLGDLIDYVTMKWRTLFVMTDINSIHDISLLAKRPFFLHISVDAPLNIRWNRYQKHYPGLDFVSFAEASELQRFDKGSLLTEVISKADVKIINTSSNITELYSQLDELNLLDETRLRPSWDSYFMRLADLAALRSNCMKRRVGAVIARDKRVIATGYNGTPRHMTNCNEGGCPRCNTGNGSGAGLSTCLCLHAEENALLESGRDRIGTNATLYCNTCPCLTCSVKIVQSGITEVVYSQSYSMDDLSSSVLKEGGVILRQFVSPKDGVMI
ncbi:CYFA0S09e01530g1_1 [Cyberlindnera fabianii]|uniref:Deoxycytidylate deaminase n=1 Tax=Cyberlindnera fabianii TaxID=36022 RepID=A0A061AXP4_CYBFA|nr:CYFA0S09e01530g1_1 [Cyberlindnera fabianii]